MNTIEQNICEAIDIIVKKAISEAEYDKTIQATIESCVDATIGKYKIKYQDSTFYAYSGSSEITYPNGAVVYVLVPGNDMSKDKTILGMTKKLGINYVVTTEGDEAYDINGSNCVSSSGNFGLCSYRQGNYVKILYHKDYSDAQNLIKINKTAVEQYIKTSGTIICGGTIRTALAAEQQLKGNYGIIFALDFLDNTNNNIVTRYYTIDVDKMTGNPYKLIYDTRQYGIFDIDNINFQQVNYISLFTYDFPHFKPESQCIDDIFISNIELCGAIRLSEDDINNYSLSIVTPKGTFFDDTSTNKDTLLLQAQVRIKGKVVNNESQQLSFYWFIEHVGITSQSQYYNKYGGQGWKCLNNYNIIQKQTNTTSTLVEWIPASYEWTIKHGDIIAREVKYKCVAVYEDIVISKTVIIKNLTSNYDITIVSDEGEQFYFDIGFPTLTCLINGVQINSYTYSWGVTNNTGTFQTLSETPELNNDYNNLKLEYDKLINDIQNEKQTVVLTKDKLLELENELNKYERITRIEKNKIHNLNINTITNFSIYQCTVYSGNTYLGTASIILKNNLEAEGAYNLIINDGSYSYKYNENGISPASSSLDSPISIKALTFTVYNNLGQKIDDDIIKHADIKWIVPTSNTLLEIPSSYSPSAVDLINNTKTYSNLMSFSYSIADRYDITKTRNNIELQINYKSMQLVSKTDLTFIKEGESGTNGTEFVCRIVPNVATGIIPPLLPIITQINTQPYFLNYTPVNSGKFFRAQLWHNENKILDSVTSGTSTEGKSASITWSILRNKYTSNIQDASSLNVNASTGIFEYSGYNINTPAHIVKVIIVYDGVTYYATIPVITVRITNSNYRVVLKEGTGFLYAVYTADGRSPNYDNTNPFELIVTQSVGTNTWEDVSQKTSDTYKVTYNWTYLGKVYEDSKWVNSINIGDRTGTTVANQKLVKPLDTFDGQCVTNALEGIVYKNNTEIARIHIPIHLLLNKYGHSALNHWDGNSIAIDENGGFILSPQVGAGIKENDNSFTGVLMGKVKEANKSKTEVGLFGYAHGIRSIFLDAETGKAQFGATGKGQIIIDPTNNKAQIYSGNYSTTNKAGLMIDLTTPEIKFGSGNFAVDKNGYITSKGGGTIAGWNIDNDSLFTDAKSSTTNVRISSANFTRTINGNSRENLRLALGSKFAVSSNGTLYAGDAIIGTGTNKITIGKSSGNSQYSAIYSGSKSAFNADASGFYIGTDGIALGSYNGSNSAFQVTNAGQMTARSGYIGNGSSGWQIGANYLRNGKTSYSDTANGVYLGTDGISLGAYFKVNSSGQLTAKRGTIAGWSITDTKFQNADGDIYLGVSGLKIKDSFSVNSSGKLTASGATITGKITASSGSIGGWTINESSLKGGSVTLNSSGAISGSNWSITAAGQANFKDINVTGGTVAGSTVSSGIKGANINNASIGSSKFNDGVKTWVGNIAADKITAASIKTSQLLVDSINNKTASWNYCTYIYKRDMTWVNKKITVVTNTDPKQTFELTWVDELESKSYYKQCYFLRGVKTSVSSPESDGED